MKQILIINGSGGVGKDTFVGYLSNYIKVLHVSIVDKAKHLAAQIGWDGSKTEKDRKFLSDLKTLIDEYNDDNYKTISHITSLFLDDSLNDKKYEVLCVDMREKQQIDRYVKDFGAKKVLITRSSVAHITSNIADRGVFDCDYDYVIHNDGTMKALEEKAKCFADTLKGKYETKMIYISHPYGGKASNLTEIESLIKNYQREYPTYIFISPCHCFGFLYNDIPYDTGIKMCLSLLNKCDEMWVCGKDIRKSTGCMAEIRYCTEHKIPLKIKGELI